MPLTILQVGKFHGRSVAHQLGSGLARIACSAYGVC